jgi:hypothetical protein
MADYLTVRGYRIGPGEDWDMLSLPVLGAGAYRTPRAEVPGVPGTRPTGQDVAGAGIVEVEVWHKSGNRAVARAAVAELKAAWSAFDELGTTTLLLDTAEGPEIVNGRPMLPAVNQAQIEHGVASALLQFDQTDPLVYTFGAKSVSVGFGGTSGGLLTPFDTPFVTTGSGTTGDVPLFNGGSASAPWVATISATTLLSRPRLILGGKVVEVGGDIPANETATLDSDDQAFRLAGAPLPWVAAWDWPEVPPGASTLSARASAGTGTVLLTWQDARH